MSKTYSLLDKMDDSSMGHQDIFCFFINTAKTSICKEHLTSNRSEQWRFFSSINKLFKANINEAARAHIDNRIVFFVVIFCCWPFSIGNKGVASDKPDSSMPVIQLMP